MVSTAEHIRTKLKMKGIPCTLVNGRFVKPVDLDMVDRLAENHKLLITLEENISRGGFGERVTDHVSKNYPELKVMNITLPDAYVEHGDVSILRNVLGIDSDACLIKIEEALKDCGLA
jgi:1-deoxy-D-xylulose-5-phosphate synthase